MRNKITKTIKKDLKMAFFIIRKLFQRIRLYIKPASFFLEWLRLNRKSGIQTCSQASKNDFRGWSTEEYQDNKKRKKKKLNLPSK